LVALSELPNTENPAPIGKPREDIYAVRFLGNKGYVVTFRTIDPLYILDLADSSNPKIAGELEVPGVSTYLQLLDEDTLLGIGDNGNGGEMIEAFGPKISIFDVSDANNPTLADTMTWPGDNTSASYDYKAVTFLHDTESDVTRLVIPMRKFQDWGLYSNGAQLLEINRDSNEIVNAGFMDNQFFNQYGTERSVIDGNGLHYINGTNVWSAQWNQPDQISGPEVDTSGNVLVRVAK